MRTKDGDRKGKECGKCNDTITFGLHAEKKEKPHRIIPTYPCRQWSSESRCPALRVFASFLDPTNTEYLPAPLLVRSTLARAGRSQRGCSSAAKANALFGSAAPFHSVSWVQGHWLFAARFSGLKSRAIGGVLWGRRAPRRGRGGRVVYVGGVD